MIDTFEPQYDADGNQTLIKTSTGVWSVTYNAENRPVRWESGDTVITMNFDRMGRRVFYKEEVAGVVTKHHKFVYDNYLCVQKVDALNNNAQINLFVWDPTEPVATRPLFTTGSGNRKFFYTCDGNKNVSELVHFETRNGIAAHYDYAPFGAVTRAISASAITDNTFTTDNPFRFSSEYHDDTLGLVYYNYRHYNPTDGRWCGRDPVGENDEQMLYLFVTNCSITEVDILGLWDNPQGIVDAFNGPSSNDAHHAYIESLLPPKRRSRLTLPAIDFSSMIGYKGERRIPVGLAWSIEISVSGTFRKGCCFQNGEVHSYSELQGTFGVSVHAGYSISMAKMEPVYETIAKVLAECPKSKSAYAGNITFSGTLLKLKGELTYEYDFATKKGEWSSNVGWSFTEFGIEMSGGGSINYTIVKVE